MPGITEGDDATRFVRQAMPLCAALGIEGRRLAPDEVVLELPWDDRWCTVGGQLHGGALMALADTAGAVVAFLGLPEGAAGTTTVSSSTQLLGAVRGTAVVATARPVHAGRTTVVVETDLHADGRLVARTTQTQLVLAAEG